MGVVPRLNIQTCTEVPVVRGYINIYTCPLERITLYLYDLVDPMMVKGERGYKRKSFESFFNVSDIILIP